MRSNLGRLAAAVVMVTALTAAWAELPKAGKPAPEWEAKTTAGKAIGSKSLNGKVVLLNFFSYG